MEKIIGNSHSDHRGAVFFNNQIDITKAKRIYIITNATTSIERGWQAHKIESRWFLALSGSFEIKLVKIDDFINPSDDLTSMKYILDATTFDCLFVEPGYATSIKALEESSKLLVLSDFTLNEVDDKYAYNSKKWK